MGSRLAAVLAALVATLYGAIHAFGAAGDLDVTFANSGRIALATASAGSGIALQSDGKTVATYYYNMKVARFGTNGFLDATFGTGGISDSALGTGNASAVAIQPDGFIVVGGYVVNGGNGFDLALARLDTDGHVDATFGTGGSVVTTVTSNHDQIAAIALQTDGKIVVGGLANGPGDFSFLLARYDSSGTLDPAFGTGGIVTTNMDPGYDSINAIAIQPDGAIVAVAHSGSPADQMVVLRYEADGDLDPTFAADGIADPPYFVTGSQGYSVALQPDGKILAGGVASGALALARFDTAGVLDPTFGDGGSRFYPVENGLSAYGLALQANGSILFGGATSPAPDSDFCVGRVLANGDLDATFGDAGSTTVDVNSGHNYGRQIALQADGKLVLTGTAEVVENDFRLTLARFLTAGPCEPGPSPDGDADFVCDAADPCLNVAGAREFVAEPGPVIQIKSAFPELGQDKLKLSASFDVPPGGFAAFDPLADGARVVLRRADTSQVIDAVLPAGAYAGKGTAGWVLNGGGNMWKFLDRTGSPVAGIVGMQVRDQSRKSPDRVAVKMKGKNATYRVFSFAYPLRGTIVLGGSSASAAGLCGEGSLAQ
jgi:uncharacterized delta-60 repeat protein